MKNQFAFLWLFLAFFNVAHAELFKETLNLSLFKNHKVFYYTEHSQIYGLNLEAEFEATVPTNPESEPPRLNATLSCDKKVSLSQDLVLPISGLRDLKFTIYPKNNEIQLKLPADAHCELKTIDNNEITQSISIVPYKERFPILEALQTNEVLSDTRTTKLLEDGDAAINRRIEILLGHKLTQKQLDDRDPKMYLDLDPVKLPTFDLLYLSTLQINHDFVTNIVFRLLAAHAKKGTPVVVTLSEVLLTKKEYAVLEWLQRQSSNIKIIRYKFKGESAILSGFFNGLHRVSHSKLFITYSKTNPELNHFIAGGRNMSDRYFFSRESVFSDSQFTNYRKEKLNPWVHFFDMDFEANSPKLVHDVLLNALDFSNITHSNVKSEELLLSVPFEDNGILEKKFIQMIDSAKERIEILSPYIYFTDQIQEAFERASARGVKIKMIVSFSLLGDAMTKQLKDIYDSFIDRVSDYSEIYQYPTDERTVMHRKAMLIDGKTSILGSVNLSQRSFIHDIESAYISDDKELAPQLDEEIKKMERISKKIDRKFEHKLEFIQNLGIKNLL